MYELFELDEVCFEVLEEGSTAVMAVVGRNLATVVVVQAVVESGFCQPSFLRKLRRWPACEILAVQLVENSHNALALTLRAAQQGPEVVDG